MTRAQTIAFDDGTFDKLTRLGRERVAIIQQLADEAFTDVSRRHSIAVNSPDGFRKSATQAGSRPRAGPK
jgi:hypothetical protein